MDRRNTGFEDSRRCEKQHFRYEMKRIFIKYSIILLLSTLIHHLISTYNLSFPIDIPLSWVYGGCIFVVALIIYLEYWNTQHRLTVSDNMSYRFYWQFTDLDELHYQRTLRKIKNDIEEKTTVLNIYKSFSPFSMIGVLVSLIMGYTNQKVALALVVVTTALMIFVLHKLYSTFMTLKFIRCFEETNIELLERLIQNNNEEVE